MNVYVDMYVYVCVYIYVYAHVYIYIYIYIHVYVYVQGSLWQGAQALYMDIVTRHTSLFGGSWDSVTTADWAYNKTYSFPNWPHGAAERPDEARLS